MIQTLGSFAAIWLLLWLVFALLLLAAYSKLRQLLFRFHAGYASALLLGISAVPMLLSLLCSLLLFTPAIEALLIREHCHQDCVQHTPLFQSMILTWAGLLAAGILIGYFAVTFWVRIIQARRLNRQLHSLSTAVDNDLYRRLSNAQPLVFTVGWWRNTVYVSEGIEAACDPRELDIVCAHEQGHSDRKDNLRLLFAQLFTLLLPPRLKAILLNDLQLFTESACDFRAAKQFGSLDVAATFLKIQRLMPQVSKLPAGACAINGSPIEQRVTALIADKQTLQPTAWQTAGGLLLLAVMFVLSIDPLHHGAEWLLGLA